MKRIFQVIFFISCLIIVVTETIQFLKEKQKINTSSKEIVKKDFYISKGKRIYPKFGPVFYSYVDSFIRYSRITNQSINKGRRNEKSYVLMQYYNKKIDSAYKAMFPDGNPEDDSVLVEKSIDTTCFDPKY